MNKKNKSSHLCLNSDFNLLQNNSAFINPWEFSKINSLKIDELIILCGSSAQTRGNQMRLENIIWGLDEVGMFKIIKTMFVGYGANFPFPSRVKLYTTGTVKDNFYKADKLEKLLDSYLSGLPRNRVIGFLSTFQSGRDFDIVKNSLKSRPDIKCVFVGCESSFAYINEPSEEALERRRRREIIERFKFASTESIITFYLRLLTPYLPIYEVASHPPCKTFLISTSAPLSIQTIKSIKKIRNKSFRIRRILSSTLLASKKYSYLSTSLTNPDLFNIHLSANDGCFDAEKIGTWWTTAQFKDALLSAKKIIYSLLLVSRNCNKVVVLSSGRKFVDYVLSLGIDEVFSEKDSIHDKINGVVVIESPELSESEHVEFMSVQDIVIHRTSQANSFCKALYGGVASIIFTIPAKGYMDAEETDAYVSKRYRLIHFTSSSSVVMISKSLTNLLMNKKQKRLLISNQDIALENTNSNPNINFFDVIKKIFLCTS